MNTYELITEKVLEMLAAGVPPWRKPWGSAGPARNIDGRAYRGINAFLLNAAPFGNPVYLTFHRALELGGHVKKGAHGFPVILWKTDRIADDEADDPTKTRAVFLLRHYHVFNVEQVEGLPAGVVPPVETHTHDPIPEAEAIVAGMPKAPTIEHKGARACYRPATDTVTVPPLERFPKAEEHYSTLFHELAHASGHPSRLDRKSIAEPQPFGSPDYSREELVAEMTAAFLCGACGLAPATLENSAAYLDGWTKALKADAQAVVIAAAQAQKAADYIRNATPAAVQTTAAA